jgi:hypothetical protein
VPVALFAAVLVLLRGRHGDPAVYVLLAIASYALAAILGAPLMYLFARCRWVGWWQVCAMTAVPPALVALEALVAPCCDSAGARALEGLELTGMGFALGLSFWWIAVRGNVVFEYGSAARSARKWAAGLLAAALLVLSYPFAQSFFRSDRVSATVVDAGSGVPVEGALVVAVWEIEKGRIHGHDSYVLHKAEATTDATGRFQLDAWGPKYGGMAWAMSGESPYAYVFAAGRRFEILSNGSRRCEGSLHPRYRGNHMHAAGKIVVSWNGCRIQTGQPTEAAQEYLWRLSEIRRGLCDRYRGTAAPCSEQLGRFFDAEESRLTARGATSCGRAGRSLRFCTSDGTERLAS